MHKMRVLRTPTCVPVKAKPRKDTLRAAACKQPGKQPGKQLLPLGLFPTQDIIPNWSPPKKAKDRFKEAVNFII